MDYRAVSFRKSVADAVKRVDLVEIIVNGFEFFAQAFDVTVDGSIIDIDLIVIGGVHEGVAALNHAGTLGKRLKD